MSHHTLSSCPLCNEVDLRPTDLRVHLMVEHRKSTVVDELLTAIESTELQTVSH